MLDTLLSRWQAGSAGSGRGMPSVGTAAERLAALVGLPGPRGTGIRGPATWRPGPEPADDGISNTSRSCGFPATWRSGPEPAGHASIGRGEVDPEGQPPGADIRSRRPVLVAPGPAGALGLGLVALLVVGVVLLLAWRASPRAVAVPGTAGPVAAVTASPGVGVLASPGLSGGYVIVDVAGRVRRPGLVRLPPGARVADALTAAGGALPGVDLTGLNLARKVSDGEQILVGVAGLPGVPVAGGAAGAAPTAPAGKLNLNLATQAQLEELPGVGPVLAQRILDWRTAHGQFASVDQLREVQGFGDKTYAHLAPLVTV